MDLVLSPPTWCDLDVAFLLVNVREPTHAAVQVQGMNLPANTYVSLSACSGLSFGRQPGPTSDICVGNSLGSWCALHLISSAYPGLCSGLQGGHVSITVHD